MSNIAPPSARRQIHLKTGRAWMTGIQALVMPADDAAPARRGCWSQHRRLSSPATAARRSAKRRPGVLEGEALPRADEHPLPARASTRTSAATRVWGHAAAGLTQRALLRWRILDLVRQGDPASTEPATCSATPTPPAPRSTAAALVIAGDDHAAEVLRPRRTRPSTPVEALMMPVCIRRPASGIPDYGLHGFAMSRYFRAAGWRFTAPADTVETSSSVDIDPARGHPIPCRKKFPPPPTASTCAGPTPAGAGGAPAPPQAATPLPTAANNRPDRMVIDR